MRIFTAVRHSVDPQFYYGGLWSSNFYPALQQLGHEIVESQVDLLPASRFMEVADDFTPQEKEVRDRLTQQIVEEVLRAHHEQPLDLFLSYFYNAHFDPAGFDEIHRLGIPTVNFYCNSMYQFALVSQIAAKVTYAWHTEKDARQFYLDIGANPVWVQMGADPEIYQPVSNIERQPKACFIGQRYADRDRFLAALAQANIPIAIYGSGWPGTKSICNAASSRNEIYTSLGRKRYQPGSLSAYKQAFQQNIRQQGLLRGLRRSWQQYRYRQASQRLNNVLTPFVYGRASSIPETYAAYEVVLNFSNVWADGRPGSGLIPHVRLRDFEAPMCGACYLTGYTDEIAEFYEIGKEIDTYQTCEELVDKTGYYLGHPQEAENLRDAGYKRAIQDHTWVSRFKTLFNRIGIHLPND